MIINMDNLKNRIERYLEDSGLPKTVFCRKIGITPNHLRYCMIGEKNLGEATAERIDSYLKKWGY